MQSTLGRSKHSKILRKHQKAFNSNAEIISRRERGYYPDVLQDKHKGTHSISLNGCNLTGILEYDKETTSPRPRGCLLSPFSLSSLSPSSFVWLLMRLTSRFRAVLEPSSSSSFSLHVNRASLLFTQHQDAHIRREEEANRSKATCIFTHTRHADAVLYRPGLT